MARSVTSSQPRYLGAFDGCSVCMQMWLLEAGHAHTEAGVQPYGDIKAQWRRIGPALCDYMRGRYILILRCTAPLLHAHAGIVAACARVILCARVCVYAPNIVPIFGYPFNCSCLMFVCLFVFSACVWIESFS